MGVGEVEFFLSPKSQLPLSQNNSHMTEALFSVTLTEFLQKTETKR